MKGNGVCVLDWGWSVKNRCRKKNEKLLIEETFFLLVVPLLRGKGSDGEKSKEGGRNKMKRMVGVVDCIIAMQNDEFRNIYITRS